MLVGLYKPGGDELAVTGHDVNLVAGRRLADDAVDRRVEDPGMTRKNGRARRGFKMTVPEVDSEPGTDPPQMLRSGPE